MALVASRLRDRISHGKRDNVIQKTQPGPIRHLLSASAISIDEVDDLCRAADEFEAGSVPTQPRSNKTVALLFFQSSTRTRLGFEAATVALGAHPIGMEDMSMSRTNSSIGESLEDCAAVVSRLCDGIIVRHHEVGAAARMAATSVVPVINAGDGWNEHPSQALIDIYSMRRGLGSLRGKSIAFGGDPRGRVVRSLMQLLRFEAPREIVFCPPPHYPVPADVALIAENQIGYRLIPEIKHALQECDAIMMAPYDMSAVAEPAASSYVSPHETPEPIPSPPRKSRARAQRRCCTTRCRGSTKSTRPAISCPTRSTSSRSGCRNSCGWRCSTACCWAN